jgi:epoxyqueuosine reductase
MLEMLEREINKIGCKFRILPVERLATLEEDIDAFAANEELNGFQEYIVHSMYRYDVADAGFDVRSVILIASPMPAYAKIELMWQGRRIPLKSLAISTIGGEPAPETLESRLSKILASSGHHIKTAPTLPLKRLAAASGLAVYGRNNICYAEGMGSFLNLNAFYSDLICSDDSWGEIQVAERCGNCLACINGCPTKAIRQDRFLIDNERCLSFFNEAPGEFPDWVSPTVHHCAYDCLKCQLICPMNREYLNNIAGPVVFDEAETLALLSGKELEEFEPSLLRKVRLLGMDKWIKAIPRNLRILIEQNNPTCS